MTQSTRVASAVSSFGAVDFHTQTSRPDLGTWQDQSRVDVLASAWEWLTANTAIAALLVAGGLALGVASLWLAGWFLTSVPPDCFARHHRPFEVWRTRRPLVWWTLMIGKNLLGALLVVAGLVMFVTPGQGILTLILGLVFLDVPGKQRVIRAVIRRPSILKAINRLRHRAGHPPLDFSRVE
jgi:hypothetical protein